MNPEKQLQLLLAASKHILSPDDKEVLQGLAGATDVDWEGFFLQAARNRVLPRVWSNLQAIEIPSLPDDLRKKQKDRVLHNVFRGLQFVKQLLEVVDLLLQNGIPTVPFKGPVLAQYLYGDVCKREFGDLDILIDTDDWPRTYALLVEKGYTPEFEIPSAQLRAYALAEDNLAFRHVSGIHIEVHWELSGRFLAKLFDYMFVSSQLQKMDFHNTSVSVLSPEYLLVYSCLHGVKHNWSDLDQVACVAELIGKEPDICWDEVFRVAGEFRCRRMVHVGLLLAVELFRVALPEEVSARMQMDGKARLLSATVVESILAKMGGSDSDGATVHDQRFSLYRLQVRDSFWDAVRYVLRMVFCPTKSEWRDLRFPDWFVCGYWLVRPFRIFWSAVAGTLKGQWRRIG